MKRGGAEGVCVNVIEALRNDHEVTLITARNPDVAELERFYDAHLSGVTIRRRPVVEAATSTVGRVTESLGGFELYVLSEVLLFRHAQSIEDEFDLMVSTHDECRFDGPSVQYLHLPRYGLLHEGSGGALPDRDDADSLLRSIYYRTCLAIGRFERDAIASSTLVTNSRWTAELVEQVYDVEPKIVLPPVDTEQFEDVPWEQREDGFVTINRLIPDKNVLENIEIVKRLVDRGHDVHLHVIGPRGDPGYYEEILAAADEHEFVHFEGAPDRETLTTLVANHKYGLHGKHSEHFGMVVAEMAVGGAIPFVPNSGGQREIVDGRSEQLYETVDEAVEKIDRVLSNRDLRQDLRADRGDVHERLGRDRFKDEIRDVVETALP